MGVLVLLLIVGLGMWLGRRPGRLGWAVRTLGTGLLWAVVGVAVLILAVGLIGGIRGASLGPRLVGVGAAAAAVLGWWTRARAARASPARVVQIDRIAFLSAFAVYTSAATLWLLIGLTPALAAAIPSVADQLREWGRADGVLADMALQAARAARNSSSSLQVTLDYVFSALNLALAIFLVVKVRGNRTANLLAFGMVGTAVAFNLQSHATLLVVGFHLGPFATFWHDFGVHVLAGLCYVFALLLFPDGTIDRTRGPHLMALAVVFGVASFVAIEDHTSALVLLFGVLVPAAALTAQSRRFREAKTPELRQLFRLLRAAMGLSLAGAISVLVVTNALKTRDERFTETTREYELQAPAAGTYVFYCDPHLKTMHGVVVVRAPGSATDDVALVHITARGGKFNTHRIEMVAGRTTVIRFTNTDGAAHNVSIYKDATRRDAFLVGQLFSGQDLATFTFRVFRFVFAVIPVTLFVAILRFHLWDVQRLVNRAMVYAALTGILGLAYGLCALLVGLLPGRVFHEGTLLIVWVLVAAALIRPGRRRLQTVIDKRFYREKLDTIRTLESFSAHVRDEIDLDRLAEQLVEVVSTTMHPVQVSLWLRDPDASAPRDTASPTPRDTERAR